MLGGMLRFRDSFKRYYDRRFGYSRGRAIYVPSLSQVWLPHPDTGFTFIKPSGKQSSYHLHTTFLGGFISRAPAQGTCSLSPRNAQAPSELGRIGPWEVNHYEHLRRATDIAHMWTLRC